MNRKDYIDKMLVILSDQSKFIKDAVQDDAVRKIERLLIRKLKALRDKGIIDKHMFQQLSPKGTITPRMYGLPKTHKPSIPLRPILSMSGSPYHKLAKWLVDVIEPVQRSLTPHSLRDTFEFINLVSTVNTTDKVMASFDVQSLFTNVPIDEVIDIVTDFVSNNQSRFKVPSDILAQLLKACTSNVQFLFDGVFYTQVDGVAMGSPLGPVLADIFMGHIERKLSVEINQLSFYKRYVDDIFAICENREVNDFLDSLNSAHNNLKFTSEAENENRLSFLDVCLIRREDGSLSRSVHRKATWSGQYLHFKSFAPIKYKRGLVRCLFDRIRRIVTPDQLEEEVNLLHETLKDNGYPARFIDKYAKGRIKRDVFDTVPRKNVYLSLPFKGDNISTMIKRRLDAALGRTFYAAKLLLVDLTQRIPAPPRKDPVPRADTSNIIYGFNCVCGSRYVGRTTRHFGERIVEHVPKWLYTTGIGCARSAITKHLQNTGHVIDTNTAFRILSKPKFPSMLNIAEAVFIRTLNPDLCLQKQFVVSLSLF